MKLEDELIVVGMNFENFKIHYPELAEQIQEIKEFNFGHR